MNEKKHYYKVKLEHTHRGSCIGEFIEKGKRAALAAEELMEELGAKGYTDCPRALYPGVGIGSLIFAKTPNLWEYQSIGKGEYIPNMETEQGKAIAKRIAALPNVSSDDFRIAFSIPVHQTQAPGWFVYKGYAYLCSSFALNDDDYTTIVEQEFLTKKRKVQ